MLKKQAKVLSDHQVKAVLKYLESSPRNALRNQIMFLLSLHGLRAKEVAEIQIGMLVDASGQLAEVIALEDKASKANSGRLIPMNKLLRNLLSSYLNQRLSNLSAYVIETERAEKFSANAVAVFFKRLYKKLGLVGCSLRDVMALAGHKNLAITQKYIVENPEAQRALIDGLYSSLK